MDTYGSYDVVGITEGPSRGNKYYRNYIYGHTQGGSAAIHFSTNEDPGTETGVDDNEIYYNIITGNTCGFRLDLGSGSTGMIYYGNVVYGNGTGLHFEHPNPGVTLINNIFSENTGYDIDANDTTSGLIHNNNLYFNSTPASIRVRYNSKSYNLEHVKSWPGDTPFEDTCRNTNPLFVGTSTWSDFRLQPDSPAIGAGATLDAAYDDALDPSDLTWPPSTTQQSVPWDIGAFKYQTESSSQTESTKMAWS